MKKTFLLLLAACSCATPGRQVTFVDGSERSGRAWLCIKDPDDKKALLCGDLEAALAVMKSEQ